MSRKYQIVQELPTELDEAVMERLVDVEGSHNTLDGQLKAVQSRLAALRSEHEAHLSSSNDTYAQVTKLLATTASLSETFKSFEARSFGVLQKELQHQRQEWLYSAAAQNKEFEDDVKRLLANFRSEVIAVAREGEARHEEHRRQLDFIAEKLTSAMETQQTIKVEHEVAMREVATLTTEFRAFRDEMTKRVDGLDRAVTASTEQSYACSIKHQKETLATLRDEMTSITEGLENKSDTQSEEFYDVLRTVQKEIDRLNTRITDVKESQDVQASTSAEALGVVKGELTSFRGTTSEALAQCNDNIGATLEQLQSHVTQQNERIEKMDVTVNAVTSGLNLMSDGHSKDEKEMTELANRLESNARQFQESVRGALDAQQAVQAEQLKKVESDLERRHRRLVESTHHAIEQVTVGNTDSTAAMQGLRTELQELSETVSAHARLIEAHTLDGNVDTAFTEVKDWLRDLERRSMSRAEVEEALLNLTSQVATLRQSSQSAETALSQRLDAERVARERDAAQFRAQAQRQSS